MSSTLSHQYVDRHSGTVITEKPIADSCIQFLYSSLRESAPAMFRAVTSARMSSLLGFLQYDIVGRSGRNGHALFQKTGVDSRECLFPVSYYDSYRKIFERQICYWHNRPMTDDPDVLVSPADSRVLLGSFKETSVLFIKEKYFNRGELLGSDGGWADRFKDGDFAVFRLTPDKYHYNHLPVSGRVAAFYQLEGDYHSCNPVAFLHVSSLYSKNRRVVTIIDTDVEGGTGVGMVAMVEVVAMMIGDIVQVYSEKRYDAPVDIEEGLFVDKGCPKSLFRPGSSTVVLLFEPGRIAFADDLQFNSHRLDVQSRFSIGVGRPSVETDISVRSSIGSRVR